MRKLYRFYLDLRRMGCVEGLFVEEESVVKESIGKMVYFGEILGKHSDVQGELEEKHLTVVSEDQDFITKLEELLGSNVSGYNPLSYMDEDY